jgi:hypothetical protein
MTSDAPRLDPFRLVQGNVEAPDSAPLNADTIRDIAARADVATFNETAEASTHAVIRSLPGFGSYIGKGSANENAIIWRLDQFELVYATERVVMIGGHVGADGKATPQKGDDDRRVGPNRSVVRVTLRQLSTGRLVTIATHHAIAQSDTKNKWRRGLRSRGFAGVRAEMLLARRQFPTAAIILTGDMNTVGRIVFGFGEREVWTPVSYGRVRYDRLFVLGALTVTAVFAFRTNSDHKAVSVTITLTGGPATAAVSVVPHSTSPKPTPKPSAKPKSHLGPMQQKRLARLNRLFARRPRRMSARQKRLRLKLIRLRDGR